MSPADAEVLTAPHPASDNAAVSHPPSDAEAARMFSKSVVISGIRCTLAYVIFPWVLPLLNIGDGVGPWIGLVIGAVAIGFNIASIRRFWASGHRWKWGITVLNVTVIIMLLVLAAEDISEILR